MYGAVHITSVLRGSHAHKVVERKHDRLPTFGIGKHWDEDGWRSLGRELVDQGYLVADPRHHGLSVTDRGAGVLFKGQPVLMAAPEGRPLFRTRQAQEQANPELFERLREVRRQLAEDRGVAAFVILPDRTLRAMASGLPRTRDALRQAPGVGEYKVAAFGQVFLDAIEEYVARTGATPASAAAAPPQRLRMSLSDSAHETLRMFREGMAASQIASERGLAETTIQEHLTMAVEAEELDRIDLLVSPRKQTAIVSAFNELGSQSLSPVKERLGEDYSFGELRVVRAWIRRQASTRTDD